MLARHKNALLIALYIMMDAILAALLGMEFKRDRFNDRMRIGAFSKAQCEDYILE